MDNTQVHSHYVPIGDHGMIGDLNTVALVDLNGAIDFMCFPDFDSPSIFAALLDKEKGGSFRLGPEDRKYKTKQLYLPETNILLTRFLSDDGIGELTDFMPVQELNRGNELVRRVTTVKGSVTYRLVCSPRFNYGRSNHVVHQKNGKEIIFSCPEADLDIRLISNVDINVNKSDAVASFTLKAGESADFILIHTSKNTPEYEHITNWVTKSLKDNIHYWKNWIQQSTYNGRWREIVMRSALTLKLLTSWKHGSLVAAPTFSLPEAIGGGRNWDYRFTWIRDASFSVYCLLRLGYTKEAGSFIDWVEHKCFDLKQKTNLQIMYCMNGDKNIKETVLKSFEGYKKSAPVRIGNAAYKQLQLDIYGELLDAVYLYDREGVQVSYELWQNLSAQIDWLAKNWKKKDDGIWEVRGGKKNFIYSRLMCWVAFDRAIKIANNHSYPFNEDWHKQRDIIFNTIHKDFWNDELQAFVQYSGADVVDAATLMMPLVGFISANDPRWLSTMHLIEQRLVDDFLVYRYHSESGVDGLKGQEGTFSMCTFWFIECLSMAGQLEKARLYFEKMLGYANHLGLYAEQLGFSGEHLGNFPQAFTHLGLISAAINLDKQLNDPGNSID
ncbi:glycoside hydrolase family 15 protein [Mucilaginibacter sp. SD-g]|uniref:Glycoside hydrolase family 15 protein n=2 Tax=Mucilaginibacter segetis TaxID=2793071 RepID=A0A934PTE5_9SPHI|nr:glycoside hydrolase family 15 protein [Mucilaginibacter segetis]